MTKSLKNLLLLALAISTLTFVSCSEDDDDGPGGVAGDLIGTWTSGSAAINSFTIDGQDLSTYLDEIRQALIDDGSTEAEADAFIGLFEGLFVDGFEESFEGTMTFNENGTYSFVDDEGTDSGEWELSANNETLIMDKGTADEIEVDIISLTNNRFEGLVEFDESEDDPFGEEGEEIIIAASLTIVFTR